MATTAPRTSRSHERYFYARAVGLAMWCIARGFQILGTEPARDGRGHIFLFTNEAADFADGYVAAKNEIDNLLSLAHRQAM